MKFIHAILIGLMLVATGHCQVSAIKDAEHKYYELDAGTVYGESGHQLLKAKNLDLKAKGNIPIKVENREKYSDPIGVGVINGALRFKPAVSLDREKNEWILLGNNGEIWTIQITYIDKNGNPANEYSEPYTITNADDAPAPEPQPPPGPNPPPSPVFDGLADTISNLAMKVSSRDRAEIAKYYNFLIDKINTKAIVSLDQLKAAVLGYKLQLENVDTSKEAFAFINSDGSKRKLTIAQLPAFYAECVKGFRNAPEPPTPVDPAPISEPGLRVAIITESGSPDKLTRNQLITISSVPFIQWLGQVCVKVDGQPEFRILDPSPENTQSGVWAKILALPRASTPWLVVSNGESGYSGELPDTLEQTKTIIQRFVK